MVKGVSDIKGTLWRVLMIRDPAFRGSYFTGLLVS